MVTLQRPEVLGTSQEARRDPYWWFAIPGGSHCGLHSTEIHSPHSLFAAMSGFPKIGSPFLGFAIIRTIAFWGLYWGPPFREIAMFGLESPSRGVLCVLQQRRRSLLRGWWSMVMQGYCEQVLAGNSRDSGVLHYASSEYASPYCSSNRA